MNVGLNQEFMSTNISWLDIRIISNFEHHSLSKATTYGLHLKCIFEGARWPVLLHVSQDCGAHHDFHQITDGESNVILDAFKLINCASSNHRASPY